MTEIDRRRLLAAAAATPALFAGSTAFAAPTGPAPVGGFKGAAPADLDRHVVRRAPGLDPEATGDHS